MSNLTAATLPRNVALSRIPAVLRPFTAAAGETWKGVQIMWTYKFALVGDVLGLFIIFLGINFFIGHGEFDQDSLAFTLMGFCLWTYAAFAIGNMTHALREEQQQGTLEQMCMGNSSFAGLLLGRTLATFFWNTLIILVGGGAITLLFRLDLSLNWQAIPIFVLTLLGLYGLGFVAGGATLLFKNVLSFTNLLQNVLLFVNGAIVPVTLFPEWLTRLSRALPTTLSIETVRLVTLEGASLQEAWHIGILPSLVFHSAVWFAVGLLLFFVAEREARRRGLLGQY